MIPESWSYNFRWSFPCCRHRSCQSSLFPWGTGRNKQNIFLFWQKRRIRPQKHHRWQLAKQTNPTRKQVQTFYIVEYWANEKRLLSCRTGRNKQNIFLFWQKGRVRPQKHHRRQLAKQTNPTRKQVQTFYIVEYWANEKRLLSCRTGRNKAKYFSLLTEGESPATEAPQVATSKGDKSNKKNGTDVLYYWLLS